MKKIVIICLLCIFFLIVLTNYISFGVDPCDIECDNYIDSDLREKCYNDCYEFNSN